MPQMSPCSWTLNLLLTSMTIFYMMIKLYLQFKKKKMKKKIKKSIFWKKNNWKC
uniref:ATP synthase complex subunit 8 n=1 Tax=Laodelphax striatellus TaxID=195883 RepID=D2D0K1_LAOST|nr:ATP synthase F0 subunit 8 [Laodelphax striatellus]ACI95042.1 ATP synthase F0 subunit 8 [Laodelphax striatellus]